jgi:uncharacterized membrane protein required for colicin V production
MSSPELEEVAMMENLFHLLIAVFILGMAYALISEGLWGAALMFFNVVFAGMIAFNFYEPLAELLDKTGIPWGFSDTLCLLGIFIVAVVALRLMTETLAPAMVRFPTPIYHAGRLVFGLAGAAVTVAILLLAFECAPVHKKLFTAFEYDSKPPFGAGLDHQWLGFFQHETGDVFIQYNAGNPDPFHKYGHGQRIKLFDPRGEWLVNHQNARPYGTENVPRTEEASGGEATKGGEESSAGAPPA